ncbi:MAG: hypothetical protein ABEJ77_01810 [Halanaeroarchaeum sp.]
MSDGAGLSEELEDALADHRRGDTDRAGDLVVNRDSGHVGDEVILRGRNLSPGETYDLAWQRVEGSWGVLEANEVVGPQYRSHMETVATVTADEDGAFDEPFVVPEDYGSNHTIELRADGTTVDRTAFEIYPHFELENETAPLGDFFTVRGYGIGPNPVRNNFQLSWDLGTVGFVTGVKNGGTATARIRAVGPVGAHDLRVWRSYKGFPFLQSETQSEFGPVGRDTQNEWTVEVTEPDSPPEPVWTERMPSESPLPVHYPEIDEDTGAELTITPTSGPVGTQAIVQGEGFPANERVDLVWHRHDGKRIEGTSITAQPRPEKLPSVETDGDGTFSTDVEIPSDRGASRPITAVVGGRSVAITGFMLQPSVRTFSPQSGTRGTEIDVEITGTGWTLYENTHFLVYDNKMLGYFCGNSDAGEDGVVHLNFSAAGDPGYHFIDVYPTIFETKDDEKGFECKPHLSYVDNHPVRPLPAHHFAFEITE